MIEKMKKLSVVLYYKEKEVFLEALAKAGAVHICENSEKTSEKLSGALAELQRAQRIFAVMKKNISNIQTPQPDRDEIAPKRIIDKFEELENKKESLNQEIVSLRKQVDQLLPWGDFDFQLVEKLKAAGIVIRFFETAEKNFSSINRSEIAAVEICRNNKKVYFLTIEQGKTTQLNAEEIHLPRIALSKAQARLVQLQNSLKECDAEFFGLSRYCDIVARYIAELKNICNFEKAALSMADQAGGKVLLLTAWVPLKKQQQVAEFLDNFAAWYEFADPKLSDDVPVLLHNNLFVRLFEPITKIFSLPWYFELDPTPFFAPFFMFFVGMCLGDIGYGLIIFLGSLIAFFKVPKKLRNVCLFVAILGASTMVNGFLLNSFFGSTFLGGRGVASGAGLIKSGAQYAILGSIETEKGIVYPAMQFAILVGILQVSFGIILSIVNRISNGGIVAGLQPVGFLFMIIGGLSWIAGVNFMDLNLAEVTIGPIKAGAAFTLIPKTLAALLVVAGAILHFLFNNPDLKILSRIFDPTKGLLELYFFVSGFLGNVLSYLRLFALGLAGGLLGNAFTYIALMFITREGKVEYGSPMIIFTVLVLILGHSLNLFLSMIGAFVHPLRLTFVEFYSNLGFKGGGKMFTPFARY